jgi:branched-chain amino acid transport system substrate-binding protein
LLTHLKGLQRDGVIGIWHYRDITAGKEWATEIDSHLKDAKIILLLVSAYFIASEYCSGIELQQALARHANKSARVIPIILRPCDWETMPLRELEVLPTGGKAITSWGVRDAAFKNVARGVRLAVEEWNDAQPEPVEELDDTQSEAVEELSISSDDELAATNTAQSETDKEASQLATTRPGPEMKPAVNKRVYVVKRKSTQPFRGESKPVPMPSFWKRLPWGGGIALLIGLLAIIALGLSFVPPDTNRQLFSPNKIKIVSSLPRQGLSNLQSQDIEKAIDLALEEHGRRVLGYPIDYERMDDSDKVSDWNKDLEMANAQRAADDPSVLLYIGPFNSEAANYSIPILYNHKLPMISPSTTFPALTKHGFDEKLFATLYPDRPRRNFFRLVPTDDLQGSQAAEWARSITLGFDKVYVLHDRQFYGEGIAETFAARFAALGGQVLGFEGIVSEPKGTPDPTYLEAIAKKIKESGTQLVYFGGTAASGAKEALGVVRSIAPEIEFMGADGIQTQQFIRSNDLTTGVLVTAPGMPYIEYERLNKTKGADFYAKFQGPEPKREPSPYAIYAYEAVNVSLDAIEKIGTWPDRDALRRQLMKVDINHKYEGALGTWYFNEDGDISESGYSLYEVKGNEFEFVKYKRVLASDSTSPPSFSLPSRSQSTAASSTSLPLGPRPAEQTAAAWTSNHMAHDAAATSERAREQTPVAAPIDQVTNTGARPSESLTRVENLDDIQVQIRFENPHVGTWDYGVVFRRSNDEYQLYMTWLGQWYLIVNGVVDTIGRYTPKAGTNELKFFWQGNNLSLYINNDWIEDAVLTSDTTSTEIPASGVLSAATGFQDEPLGTSVKILNFKVWRLP